MAARAEVKRCLSVFKSECADTCCRVGEVLLSFFSGVLTIVTFGTAYWLEARPDDKEALSSDCRYHSGLWQICNTESCNTLQLSGPSFLLAARFFMCVSLVSGIFSWIISIIGLLQHKARWLLTAALCYTIQGVLMLLGLGSYSKAFSSSNTCVLSPGWSYSVGWLGMVVSLLCAFYFVSVGIYRFRNPQEVQAPLPSSLYAPLAQFGSESGSSDDEENL